MSGFDVTPATVRGGGRTVGDAGGSFRSRLTSFEAELGAFEGAWGDDTIGLLIGTAYQAVSQWALECFASAADDLVSAGADLTMMAGTYDHVDRSALVMFEGIHGQLGRR